MAVGFRSLLSVDSGEPVIEALITHLGRWLAAKQIDLPADTAGYYPRSQNDVITVLQERREDGCMYRWRRHHPFALGAYEMYRTTVTAVQRDGARGWLWTEIETPSESDLESPSVPKYMSVPAFLRSLLGELSFHDGRTPVAAEPQWISEHHLPDLMDYLADETRRGPIYMVSQGGRPVEEFEPWVREVTWQVIGLGAIFLLDDEVEQEFNDMVGEAHSVAPGTIRTFQPNVSLDDANDPERHRVMSRLRIFSSNRRYLGHILGTAQRDRTTQTPMPAYVLEANRTLNERERRTRERAGRKALRLVIPGDAAGSAPSERVPAQPESAGLVEQRMSAAELAQEVVRLREENLELQRVVACHESAYEEMQAVLRTQEDHLKALQARSRRTMSNGHGRLSAL